MATITAQQAPRDSNNTAEEVIARFCLYYQQYKYSEAKKLPYKRIKQMLKVAEKERAVFFLDLLEIVVAPHTKKGSGINKIIGKFTQKLHN